MKRQRGAAVCLLLALLAGVLTGCGGKGADETKTVIHTAAKTQESGQSTAPAETAGTEAVNALAGDWYGWWKMVNTSGDWAWMDGYWWDCCAEVEEDGAELRLLLWDEDLPKETLLAILYIQSGKDGAPRCTGGEFLSAIMEEDGCKIELRQNGGEKFLTITGHYDATVKNGSFDYSIYLRPWGQRWEDAEDDELPYYYESWYLPLIEDGKEMPDEIGR